MNKQAATESKTDKSMNITKGPWEVNERLAGVVENQYGEIIATMGGTVDGSPQANARLISAAPDLLETLEGLHKALSRMIDKHDPDSIEAEWLQHSHEAICKARGVNQ